MDIMTDVSRSDTGAGMVAMSADEFIAACDQVQPNATSISCAGREIGKASASVDALPMGKQGTLQSLKKKMIREERGLDFETFSHQFSRYFDWHQLATAPVLKCADFRRKCPSNTICNTLNTNKMRIC
jgi:hypothetical protein